MTERRPIQDLLREATRDLANAEAADTAAAVQAAWHGVCVAGAAGELLSVCGDPGEYRARWFQAEQALGQAIRALRAAPSLRGDWPAEVNPAGSPSDRLDDAAASAIRQGIVEVSEALSSLLQTAAQRARGKADRRALRVCAATARELARCYDDSRAGRVPSEAASARPSRLPARDLADLRQLVNRHTGELHAADPADTTAALTVAWYGFAVASCLGGFLAARDAERAVLHDNATRVIAGIVVALEAAPSLPADIHGVGLDTEGEATDEMMRTAHRGILDLVLALNTLLPQVADNARQDADRKAAQEATRLSAELGDCYQGRLRTFLKGQGRRL
jgi:hypothetical protein